VAPHGFSAFWAYVTHLHGVDWVIMATGLGSLALLGSRRRCGFLLGMLSAAFGVVLSVQIMSLANGLTSVLMVFLHLRGYRLWRNDAHASVCRPS
jgi:nicotinamide riboside transporter PnuC